MEIDHTDLGGYETSRKEQGRLHEELAQQERALFEKLILEVFMKWKNWKDLRNGEFSRQEIERKVRLLFTSSHHKCSNCRKEWTLWTTLGKSKTSNQLAVEDDSVLPLVLKWCRNRTQKESGEERVTAKSRPMMNLVSRCSERDSCRACLLLHQKAQIMKVKYIWARGLSSI